MADFVHDTVLVSACDRCPFDAGLCLADNWRASENGDGQFRLDFTCPYMRLSVAAAHRGEAAWRASDHSEPAGHTLADGDAANASAALRKAARAFVDSGLFRPHGQRAIAAAMTSAYEHRFDDQSRTRRRA